MTPKESRLANEILNISRNDNLDSKTKRAHIAEAFHAFNAATAQRDEEVSKLVAALRDLYEGTEHLYGHDMNGDSVVCSWCEKPMLGLVECPESPYKERLDKARAALAPFLPPTAQAGKEKP